MPAPHKISPGIDHRFQPWSILRDTNQACLLFLLSHPGTHLVEEFEALGHLVGVGFGEGERLADREQLPEQPAQPER